VIVGTVWAVETWILGAEMGDEDVLGRKVEFQVCEVCETKQGWSIGAKASDLASEQGVDYIMKACALLWRF